MKKEKFSKYIEHELMVIDKKITSLTTKKETLREKVDNILTKDNLKKLRNDYKNQNSKSIFNLFKSYRKEKLIDFYIQEKTKEYEKELKKLIIKKEELKEALNSFQNGYFTIPFHPCNETLYLYLKYAADNNIPPQEFIQQILLLIKLNTLLYDNAIENQNQMKANLNSLYNDYLNIREKKTLKAVKFIIKKLFHRYTTKNEKAEKYLKEVLDSYNGERISLCNNKYKEIITKAKEPSNLIKSRGRFALKQYYQLVEETIITDEIINLLDENKLKTIKEAIEIINRTSDKNIILIIKRAIEDIISMEKYNRMCKTHNEIMDNEDITNAKTATLQRIIKTYKELNNIETTHYYLKDKNTAMPAAFNDIKTIDILNYGQIMEMLVLLDEHSPKKEVQKVKNYTIYETTYDNVIVYYTIKDKKIYIIKIGLSIYKDHYDKIDFSIYQEELQEKIEQNVQKIYAAIIENELDVVFDKNESKILLKSESSK